VVIDGALIILKEGTSLVPSLYPLGAVPDYNFVVYTGLVQSLPVPYIDRDSLVSAAPPTPGTLEHGLEVAKDGMAVSYRDRYPVSSFPIDSPDITPVAVIMKEVGPFP